MGESSLACPCLGPPRAFGLIFLLIPIGEGAREHLGGAQVPSGLKAQQGTNGQGHVGCEDEKGREGAEQAETWSRWLLFMCLKSPQLSPFGLPTGAGTDKQKEEQCQPREEQRGMLQGPEEEPQSPTVDVEHDGQQQPDDTQGSHGPRSLQKRSFKETYAKDPQEATTQPQSTSREKKYKCEHCGKVFAWENSLRRHRRTHNGENPFKCQDCGKPSWGVGRLLDMRKRKMKDGVPREHQKCSFKGMCAEDTEEGAAQPPSSYRDKKYVCEYCGKVFGSRTKLGYHRLTHTGEKDKKYVCEYCGKFFGWGKDLRNHQRTHTGEKPFKCQDCGKSFATSGQLRRHKMTHTMEKPFRCTTCGKCYYDSTSLLRHQQTHTGERPYTCSHCRKKFLRCSHLREHQKALHNGDPTVDVEHDGQQQPDDTQGSRGTRRPRKCSFKGTYDEHTQEDTTEPLRSSGEKMCKCEDCGNVFACGSTLTRHRRTHTGEKPYKCRDCGRGFTQTGNLVRHQRTHTKEKPFFYTTCGKRFSLTSDLMKHKRTHKPERPYPCSHCGKSFQQSYHLRRHQERGTSKCPECGKIFRWSNSMRRHQRNHTGERPYKCPDCGKTFKDFSSLISLHRIHKGERPYKCLQCGECFSHSSSLSTHRRTHTGEKPSSCSDCGESFTQEQTLILHQRIHPGEMPNRCQQCQKN
uniref:C2H2-type domain-containing protein n=1 Tax=Bubo bubo TaxID=30461 RepID=A0A8C0IIK7_BUBBB